MKFLLTSFVVFFLSLNSHAQDLKTAEHPFFKAMIGECKEEGKLVLPGAKEPLSMKADMKLMPILDGVWIQEDGKATTSQFNFSFRWMFQVRGETVFGRFIDSNGQIQDYTGSFMDEKNLVLRRQSKEGRYRTTVTQLAEAQWKIEVLFQPNGAAESILIYQATKTKLKS